HYTSLKVLAQSTPGFLNASVEFDIGTLSPTYRLITGIPGGSSAIEIAGRLGMDEALLDQALGLLRREDRTLERILGELQERQRRLDDEAARLGELRLKAEEAAREVTERLERLRRSEREDRQGVKQKLTAELLRARAEIQTVLDELKRERTLAKAKEAKQRLARLGTDAQAQLVRPDELVPIDSLKAGDAVEIQGLGLTGVLTESPRDKKRVRVRVGDAELSVGVQQLTGLGEASQGPFPRGTSGRTLPPSRSGVTGRHALAQADRHAQGQAETVVDLRGRTVEEAVEQTIAALDRAALTGTPWIRIIHGHGTGRLKVMLRDHLRSSPYVARFRPGERAEGGDGVTIVELATS
ncbi:MAG: Smr/MutS family protein, partial [Nitrospirales bacterium]